MENTLKKPKQVIAGYRDVLKDGFLRVPFVETEGGLKMVTVCWTSKVEIVGGEKKRGCDMTLSQMQ